MKLTGVGASVELQEKKAFSAALMTKSTAGDLFFAFEVSRHVPPVRKDAPLDIPAQAQDGGRSPGTPPGRYQHYCGGLF